MDRSEPYHLLNNLRFYVLAAAGLAAAMVPAWLRLQVPSDQLFYIRTEQAYGLICLALWYLALIISPLGYLIGKRRVAWLAYARRGIGVAAAGFGLLHLLVALFGQLGGPSGLALLPPIFKWSLLAGGVALTILLAMAATSFDAVIRYMTFRRWKWLHRLGYAGGVLAMAHIFAIGTHTPYGAVRLAAFVAMAVLTGLESYRTVWLLRERFEEYESRANFAVMFASLWTIWLVLIFLFPFVIRNYHSGPAGGGHLHAAVAEWWA